MEQNTGLDDLVSAAAMGDVESHGHQQSLLTEGTFRELRTVGIICLADCLTQTFMGFGPLWILLCDFYMDP